MSSATGCSSRHEPSPRRRGRSSCFPRSTAASTRSAPPSQRSRPRPSDLDEQRDRVLEQARAIAKTTGPKFLFPKEYGGLDEVGAAITAFETQAFRSG